MRSLFQISLLVAAVLAERLFLEEPDTGLETYLYSANYTDGELPRLKDMRGIPDFDWAAQHYLDNQKYSFYRTGNGGEWSYRNNLEIWSQVKFRPRQLNDVSKLSETLPTSFLGYNFSAPFFISPAARAGYADPERAELNFVDASAAEETLYVAALYASKTIEEIQAQKHNGTLNGQQVIFQQIYSNANLSVTWDAMARAEAAGVKAFVWTIDAPGDSTRHRAARYDTTNANSVTSALTWDLYDEIRNHTSLPVIPKGITTVEDALLAIEKGAPAIWISNHGGRQLDHSPSSLEIAYEIHRNAPQVFTTVDVMADSGIRYGTDVLKLLALGVKMIGMGRPFMFANIFGVEGVRKAIQILKNETIHDGAQAGVTDLRNVSSKVVSASSFCPGLFRLKHGSSLIISLVT
jgi:L-lactate dehydrogenase (cytochrome)